MRHPEAIPIDDKAIDQLGSVVEHATLRDVDEAVRAAARLMEGRRWWHINSTARGGGVAEMLPSLLGYARGLGIDARWLVIDGDEAFFHLTKRLHHALHGMTGDDSPLGPAQRELYAKTMNANTEALLARIHPGDVVLLHDPQTAGLAPALVEHGAIVAWRSHIGADTANAQTTLGWDFLRPWLDDVSLLVFSRAAYIPDWCVPARSMVIMPSIDPLSPKNQEIDEATLHAILARAGMLTASAQDEPIAPVRIERRADVTRLGPPLDATTPVVAQVSRWDPLKDPLGVMRGFARVAASDGDSIPTLLLVGPDVTAVADDPEAVATVEEARAAWTALPESIRRRIQLVSLPMDDIAENAAIVNASQRHATVLVQKSLREGFGLTVTEAMWKGKPVIASGIGGIVDQIDDGVDGILLPDPTDTAAFATSLQRLLADPERAARSAPPPGSAFDDSSCRCATCATTPDCSPGCWNRAS